MFWNNPNLLYVIDTPIIEYDIKSGNVSIMRAFKDQFDPPLEDAQIDQLSSLDKKARVIQVGKMMRDIPNFSKVLEKGFNQAVKAFCDENRMDLSDSTEDIVSIKRDAVFVVGKPIKHTKILEYCHFIPKNEYDGYIRLKGYEFYINSREEKIDVKGMDDAQVPLHQEGILAMLLDFYRYCKSVGMNRVKLSEYLAELCDAYLSKDLPFSMYREFNNESKYRIHMGGREFLTDTVEEEDLEDLSIDFNYLRILIPLLNVFI